MSRFVRFLRSAWLALLGALLAIHASAAAPAAVELAFTIDLPPNGAPLAEIGRTLVAVSSARTWTVKEKSDGKIVVQLIHRKIDATVTYVFTEQKIQAYCESYQVDSSGKRGKPEQPTRWLKYLQDDLRRLLGSAINSSAPVAQKSAPAVVPAISPAVVMPPPAVDPTSPPQAAPVSAPTPRESLATTAPAAPAPAAPRAEGMQLVQFPPEAVSAVSYYSRVYVIRPKHPTATDAPSIRILDESPGAQAGPGRAFELGALDTERVFGWNRPAGIMSLRAHTGAAATPRLALELAAGKAYYIVVEGTGATTAFRQVPEAEGKDLLAASKPATVSAEAPDSLDAYLIAAASDGRTDAVKRFLTVDKDRSYGNALAASIDQAQPQVTNMLVQAGATLPAENTPDARFRAGAVQKAMGDMLVEQGKPGEAKGYYEQAMKLFNAVKPELMAAAEAKFKKAQEGAKKDSFWTNLAGTALKAMANSGGVGGTGAAPATSGGNQQIMAQLLALKDSPTFEQFFSKMRSSGATGQNTSAPANPEIPKEIMALLESVTTKAALEKTMSERCDSLIADIGKKLASMQ